MTQHVLAVSGSLRQSSLNTAMLRMAQTCAPQDMDISLFEGMAQLPLFNPDLENTPPASVQRWQHAIATSDAVLIASPEYAHGVSGVMKNALDWTVAAGVFVDKPVVLWNASPRASIALAALTETLQVMSARVLVEAHCSVLIPKTAVTSAWVNPPTPAMQAALRTLQNAIAVAPAQLQETC